MKTLYITTQEEFLNGAKHFSSAHYIDLPNGKILLAGEHRTSADKKRWEARNTITILPHPLSGKKIGPDVAQDLSSIGALPSHTVWDIAELGKKTHKGISIDE